jgi:hypothetical protein
MTLEDFISELRNRERLFELFALRQQNAEQLSQELSLEQWEQAFALWLGELP